MLLGSAFQSRVNLYLSILFLSILQLRVKFVIVFHFSNLFLGVKAKESSLDSSKKQY